MSPFSLIYQLLDYERKLKGSDAHSPSSDRSSLIAEEEAEWSRRRQMMEEESDDDDHESRLVMQEAQALDKAMEDRIVARKSSASSVGSSLSGVGMGAAWRSRYSRKRAGSVASNTTNGSVISEDLVEVEEEQSLLGVGGGFESDGQDPDKVNDEREQADNPGSSTSTSSTVSNSPEDLPNHGLTTIVIPPRIPSSSSFTPRTARPRPMALTPKSNTHAAPPPSAPVWKTSFGSIASSSTPRSAFRPSFDLSTPKANKRRPTPLGSLSTIPPSPIAIIAEGDYSSEASETESIHEVPLSPKAKAIAEISRPPSIISSYSSASSVGSRRPSTSASSQFPSSFSTQTRMRTESRRPAPPPLHLRTSVVQRAKDQTAHKSGKRSVPPSQVSTPSQTLFVFPPSPTLTTRTPSTMTLTSAATPRDQNIPFPTLATPRVSTFRGPQGRTRSFIGLGPPPTPTTGFSRVDVRGYVGLE